MERPARKEDVVGKTIARLLRTEWEHIEDYSSCGFFVEFTDGALIDLGIGSLLRIDANDIVLQKLRDIQSDPDSSPLLSSEQQACVGLSVEKVLRTRYNNVYLALTDQCYLTPRIEECETQLWLHDHDEFLGYARIFEFFDYWTNEPCIFENMRAIDLIVKSSVDDLDLWQSQELFLTIGHIATDGKISNLTAIPNKPDGEIWKARFVVPRPGTYRVIVQRLQEDFVSDVVIDESTISEGLLDIEIT